MRPARRQPKVRLNLDMTVEAKEQLERIPDEVHADSMGEVIRRALPVCDYLHSEQANGAHLLIRTKDGVEKGLPLF